MRPILVLERVGRGGTEAYVAAQADVLENAGHAVAVLALDGIGGRLGARPVQGVAGPRGLRAHLGAAPGVALLHLYAPQCAPAVRACRAARAPCVAWLHMPLAPWSLRHRLAWRRATAAADAVAAVSAACLAGHGALRRAAVVPPVLVPRVAPRRVQPPVAGPLRIAGIGRLAPEKDWPTLLRAAARLGARVTLHGAGPLRAELAALGARLGVALDLPGWSAPDALAARLRAPDGPHAAVLPSRFEGLGLAAAETMALGVPTVVSDVAGHAGLARHGVTALRMPPGDPEALAAALARLGGDPALRARLGRDGARATRAALAPARHLAATEGLLAGLAPAPDERRARCAC